MSPTPPDPPTTYFEALLQRLAAGDAAAWPLLVVAMQGRLEERARARLRVEHLTGVEPGDIAHEITLRLQRYVNGELPWIGDQVPGAAQFWGLVGRMVYNLVRDLRRNRRVRKGRAEAAGPSPAVEDLQGEAPPGDLLAEASEVKGLMKDLLDALSETSRQLILFHDFAGLTFAEIGERLGWLLGQASGRYYRARAELGGLIRQRGLQAEDFF